MLDQVSCMVSSYSGSRKLYETVNNEANIPGYGRKGRIDFWSVEKRGFMGFKELVDIDHFACNAPTQGSVGAWYNKRLELEDTSEGAVGIKLPNPRSAHIIDLDGCKTKATGYLDGTEYKH